jgi:hypothetical protein
MGRGRLRAITVALQTLTLYLTVRVPAAIMKLEGFGGPAVVGKQYQRRLQLNTLGCRRGVLQSPRPSYKRRKQGIPAVIKGEWIRLDASEYRSKAAQ